jgi:hypothetical protein
LIISPMVAVIFLMQKPDKRGIFYLHRLKVNTVTKKAAGSTS